MQKNRKLITAFFITLLAMFVSFSFFSKLRVTYFAPFCILIYYEKSKIASIWASLICGIFMDAITFNSMFGSFTLNYCCTTFLLYNRKTLFFEDSLSTIPILTYLFSIISTFSQYLFLSYFSKGFEISLKWIYCDLFVMPLTDSIYALLFFTLPLLFIKKPKQFDN